MENAQTEQNININLNKLMVFFHELFSQIGFPSVDLIFTCVLRGRDWALLNLKWLINSNTMTAPISFPEPAILGKEREALG